MAKVPNPCVKTCPNRCGTCHATCEPYALYRASKMEEYEARRKVVSGLPCIGDNHKANARKKAKDQLRGRRVNTH